MYSVLNCHNVAKHIEFYRGWLRFNVTSTSIAGCFKNNFKIKFQMSQCGECYVKGLHLEVYTLRIVQCSRC
jgi:hypothetical protein